MSAIQELLGDVAMRGRRFNYLRDIAGEAAATAAATNTMAVMLANKLVQLATEAETNPAAVQHLSAKLRQLADELTQRS